MSEVHDTIEISIPVHSSEAERRLDEIQAELLRQLDEAGEEDRPVTLEKKGELPEMEVTLRCYLADGGSSWKKVRMLLTRKGILELQK
jgi:hypothetical protein